MDESSPLKTCSICSEEKSLDEYYKNTRGKQGVGPYCKECHKERGRQKWALYSDKFRVIRKEKHSEDKKHPDYIPYYIAYGRANYLKRTYKLTEEEFDLLLTSQNGCCAICATEVSGGLGTFHVDHDHKCCSGKETCGRCIRGILCNKCNLRLDDEISWHEKAIQYLANYAAKS